MKVLASFTFSCVVATFLCVGMLAQVGVLPKKDVTLKQTTDEKFRVGDVWEYETRKGEERSKITILRIDESPELGIIVHVAVDSVRLSNCHGGPEPDAVPHMPFARKALDASVKKRRIQSDAARLRRGRSRMEGGLYTEACGHIRGGCPGRDLGCREDVSERYWMRIEDRLGVSRTKLA